MEPIYGKAWLFGDHINTDQIISSEYMHLTSKKEMAKYTFQNLASDFTNKVEVGDIVVAGKNFGGGSAREQAPEVLKELGVGAVIATSFNMIFFRNSINIGLPVIKCPQAKANINEGDNLKLDIDKGIIENKTSNSVLEIVPFSNLARDILECSGLVNYYHKNKKEAKNE